MSNNETTEVTTTDINGTTEVSFTVGPNVLGADLSFTVKHTFNNDATNPEFRAETINVVQQVLGATLEKAEGISSHIRGFVGRNPKGYVSVHEAGQAPAPAHAGPPVSVPNAAGVAAVAAGAPISGADGWVPYLNRFGPEKPIWGLSPSVFSTDQLKAASAKWLHEQGLNVDMFDIYDERLAAENGQAISTMANIKLKKDHAHLLQAIGKPTNLLTVCRVEFKSRGNSELVFKTTKEFGPILEYRPIPQIFQAQATPAIQVAPVPAPQAGPAYQADPEEDPFITGAPVDYSQL